MTTNSPHSAVPYLMKNVSYDPIKDFSFVSRLGSFTLLLCVHPSVPAKSIKELVDYAKNNPGEGDIRQRQHAGIVGGATMKHFRKPTCCTCPTRARRRPSPTCWLAGCR